MTNDEILQKLKDGFGLKLAGIYCRVNSLVHAWKYSKPEAIEEHLYEAQWWDEAGNKIADEIIKQDESNLSEAGL